MFVAKTDEDITNLKSATFLKNSVEKTQRPDVTWSSDLNVRKQSDSVQEFVQKYVLDMQIKCWVDLQTAICGQLWLSKWLMLHFR